MRTFKLSSLVFTLLMAACDLTPPDPAGPIANGGGVPPDNHAPSVTAATIEDRPYHRGDVITVTPEGWNDVDNDPPSYRYQWFVNGVTAPGENLASLQTDAYAKGATIACGVLPYDGFVSGPPVVSNIVALVNSAPVLATVSLGGPHTRNSVIRAMPLDATDADDDVLQFEYQWILNGVPLAAKTSTLSGIFVKGDSVQAIVTASDGEESSAPVSSAVITILDIPPVMTSVSIGAGPFTSTDTITASAAGSDGDGDAVTFGYQWYVNGYASSGATASTFSGGFSRNDQVYVTTWPFDGEQQGASLFSNVVLIQNSPPVVVTATIPTGSYRNGVAVPSSVTVSDSDASDILTVAKSWYVNNVFAGSGNSLSGATLKRGDTVYFVAVPYDMVSYGAPVSSNAITILNTPPTTASVAITPARPNADEILRANLTSLSSDADGDGVSYKFAWYRNDVLQGFPNALTTISAALTTTGDTWKVVVTPTDSYNDGSSDSDSVTVYGNSATLAVAISSSNGTSCALLENGSVSCWGDNFYGQIDGGVGLGIDYGLDRMRLSPQAITGLTEPFASLNVGPSNACGVTRVGGVVCWGQVYAGAISGTVLVPTTVMGLTSGIQQVASGLYHTCVLTDAGGVKCWGSNWQGQIGDGGAARWTTVPSDVTGLQSGVASISSSEGTTCAVLTNGSVQCWGRSYNPGTHTTTPVAIAGLNGFAVGVSVGLHHACAAMQDLTARCWGSNGKYELGDGTTTFRASAVAVNGLTGVVELSTSNYASCAKLVNTSVVCWGSNDSSELGKPAIYLAASAISAPVVVVENGVAGLSQGYQHGCTVLTNGNVKCWGWNTFGQMGDGMVGGARPTPTKVMGLPAGTLLPVTTGYSSCTAIAGGQPYCWGDLGLAGKIDLSLSAVPVTGFPAGVTVITSSMIRAGCFGLSNNEVWCWTGTQYAPATAPTLRLAESYSHLVAGVNSRCGASLTSVRCWLSSESQPIPVATGFNIDAVNAPKQALTAGYYHFCGINAGTLSCWGTNSDGQVGNGSPGGSVASPTQVSGLTGVIAVAGGRAHTCAIESTGVKCWGNNDYGQLGDGTNTPRYSPTAVAGTAGAIWIAAGSDHTCIVRSDGDLMCWGYNVGGQVGTGAVSIVEKFPVTFSLPEPAVSVSAGYFTTCANTTTSIYCLGGADTGQVGDGYIYWMPHLIKGFGGVFP